MKLSESFLELKIASTTKSLSVESLLIILGSKSHLLLIAFFTVPFLQPIPTFGLSAPFGLTISLIGLFFAFDCQPWLPKKVLTIIIPSEMAIKIFSFSEKIFKKIETFIRPRALFVVRLSGFQFVTGLLIFINGVLLSLPLPIPFSNAAPAWSILILSVACVEDDGYLIGIGYLASLLSIVFVGSATIVPALYIYNKWLAPYF